MSKSVYFFSTNVPQANQKISSTQVPINSNFLAINDWINVNHVGFNDPLNYGKHNFTSLVVQGSDPVTSATEMAVYSKATIGGNNPAEIFYRYPNNGPIQQLSGGGTGAVVGASGYSYLPTGIIMKWGQATGIVSGNNIITFPTSDGIPAFSTSVYTVTFSPVEAYTEVAPCPYISSTTLATFTLSVPGTFSPTVQWMAIGV